MEITFIESERIKMIKETIKTEEQLRYYLNNSYGMTTWPEQLEVSAELYGRVCQTMIDHMIQINDFTPMATYKIIEFKIGENGGLKYKNVELIIKKGLK